MPIVRPDFTQINKDRESLIPGRYVLRAVEAKESDKLDKNGNNALVVKFQVVNNKKPAFNGQKVSRWFSLGGQGAIVLYRFLQFIDPSYDGKPFTTEQILGKTVEADVILEKNPESGKVWAKVERLYPYLTPGEVSATLAGNVQETDIPDFDDFDK